MKLITWLLPLAIFLLSGCEKEDWCNCLEKQGTVITSHRDIPNFFALEMSSNVDVILQQGPIPGVEVTCGEHLMDGITTEVIDGRLYVDNINRCNWLRDFDNKFTVTVTCPELTLLTNRGCGNLSCPDTIRGYFLQIDNWNGSGTLSLLLNYSIAQFKLHTGPADIIAAGKCGNLYIYSAGNGYVKVASVDADFTYVTSKSTGDCEVSAHTELQAYIQYDGDIYYKGNPNHLYYDITGNGKLIPF